MENIDKIEYQIEALNNNSKNIAYVHTTTPILTDVQSALDLMATVRYETECDAIIVDKTALTDEFFDLKTRLAGEIIQKYVNYGIRLAIIGDFSGYTSKALHDFIYESNQMWKQH
ncbi:MAG: DUF4180 domain-containing protein [Acetobacterium sp.]|nr:DUF4180 domain-containing protein [Bacillota bacterium]MCG2730634.1 DUF4180 domain-containing protein [Acetobacterium sp.]